MSSKNIVSVAKSLSEIKQINIKDYNFIFNTISEIHNKKNKEHTA